jgi:hypothetical protein
VVEDHDDVLDVIQFILMHAGAEIRWITVTGRRKLDRPFELVAVIVRALAG